MAALAREGIAMTGKQKQRISVLFGELARLTEEHAILQREANGVKEQAVGIAQRLKHDLDRSQRLMHDPQSRQLSGKVWVSPSLFARSE